MSQAPLRNIAEGRTIYEYAVRGLQTLLQAHRPVYAPHENAVTERALANGSDALGTRTQ